MIKPKKTGRMIAILAIILALFVAIMTVVVYNNWIKDRTEQPIGQITPEEEEKLQEIYNTNFYDNGWDKKIVAQIVESEVPVPAGFEFVSGTKETGLIIKDTKTNAELMWIPYNETATVEGIEEYYKNVNYQQVDSETIDSIQKYGGFYITLEEQNQYEVLKQVDNSNYQKALKEASKIYENSESVNSHLLSLTELQQVLAFAKKNGIEYTQTSVSNKKSSNINLLIEKGSTITKAASTTKKLGLISVDVEAYSSVNKQDAKYDAKYIVRKSSSKSRRKNDICANPKRI